MRIAFLGDTGEGKTLSAVYMCMDYINKGFKIYSNIKLKGIFEDDYTFINNSNFIETINNKEPNVILIDEIGLGTYTMTANSISLSHFISQSRKSIGEKSHLIYTTQLQNQLNPIVRGLCDYMIFPTIVVRSKEDERPLGIVWRFYKKDKDSIGKTVFIPYKDVIIRTIEKALEQYTTDEITEKFIDGKFEKLDKLYKRFKGTKNNIKNLTSILIYKERVNPTEAERLARYIIFS